jgi:hypothetical protein
MSLFAVFLVAATVAATADPRQYIQPTILLRCVVGQSVCTTFIVITAFGRKTNNTFRTTKSHVIFHLTKSTVYICVLGHRQKSLSFLSQNERFMD